MEMYLAGVSVRRVEDITEHLWGMVAGRPFRATGPVPGHASCTRIVHSSVVSIGRQDSARQVTPYVPPGKGGGSEPHIPHSTYR